MTTKKLMVYELRFKGWRGWCLIRTRLVLYSYFPENKRVAIRAAAKDVLELTAGSGASLRIFNLDGKIAEERTYPRKSDPRRSKG